MSVIAKPFTPVSSPSENETPANTSKTTCNNLDSYIVRRFYLTSDKFHGTLSALGLLSMT